MRTGKEPDVLSAPASDTITLQETKSKPGETARPATAARETARLGPGVSIKGKISSAEDLQLDGSMEGRVSVPKGRFTLGRSGRLTGDVVAREIVVYGTIKGDLRAGERIEVKKDGTVQGKLTTSRIEIEEGAFLKASVEIELPPGREGQNPSGTERGTMEGGPAKTD